MTWVLRTSTSVYLRKRLVRPANIEHLPYKKEMVDPNDEPCDYPGRPAKRADVACLTCSYCNCLDREEA